MNTSTWRAVPEGNEEGESPEGATGRGLVLWGQDEFAALCDSMEMAQAIVAMAKKVDGHNADLEAAFRLGVALGASHPIKARQPRWVDQMAGRLLSPRITAGAAMRRGDDDQG